MMLSSSSTAPTLLLDTSVISGFVKRDMKPEDAAAFATIADMAQNGAVTIVGSTVTKEELNRIPDSFRVAHLREYQTLEKIRGSNVTWLDTNPSSTGFGTVVEHPSFAGNS